MKPEYFEDSYKLLGLSGRKNITDEMVLEAYKNIKNQIANFRRKARTQEELQFLDELEIAIDDSYNLLRTEEKRQKYDEFLKEVEKEKQKQERNKFVLNLKKDVPKITREEYEKRIKEYEEIGKKFSESVKNAQTTTKRANQDGIDFRPIYRGEFNKTPPKDKEDNESR